MDDSTHIKDSSFQPTEVVVNSLSTDGRGVFRIDGRVYFIAGGLPGDRILAELQAQTRPPSARLIRRVEDSPCRVVHPCPHSPECCGSVWGSLSYSEQLKHKQELTLRTLRKAVGDVEVLPTVPSPSEWNYRSRITLSVWTERRRLQIGYQTESRQAAGVAIRICKLADGSLVKCIKQLADLFGTIAVQPSEIYPKRIQMHRTARGAGLLLVFPGAVTDAVFDSWVKRLEDACIPGGIWLASGTQAGIIDSRKTIRSTPASNLMTTTWLEHELEVHPASFAQVNSAAADCVHKKLQRIASENRWRNVWDLYGGYGALGCAAAGTNGSALTVLELTAGSEIAMQALAQLAGVKQTRFIAGDLVKTLPRHIADISGDDVIILDPPRSGAHADVITAVGQSRAREIYYLSCNPARLGRDLMRLMQAGFQITEIEPYDFFPQTPRVEVLARLRRD